MLDPEKAFEIIKEMGTGVAGSVKAAKRKLDGRPCALKYIESKTFIKNP